MADPCGGSEAWERSLPIRETMDPLAPISMELDTEDDRFKGGETTEEDGRLSP